MGKVTEERIGDRGSEGVAKWEWGWRVGEGEGDAGEGWEEG